MNKNSHDETTMSDSTDIDTQPEKRTLKIGYMVNPDPVFFNELDYKLIDELKELGAEIIEITF